MTELVTVQVPCWATLLFVRWCCAVAGFFIGVGFQLARDSLRPAVRRPCRPFNDLSELEEPAEQACRL